MKQVSELFDEYKQRANKLLSDAKEQSDRNAALIALENQMVDASTLPEGERIKLRAYMEEYRRLKIDDYEAGA